MSDTDTRSVTLTNLLGSDAPTVAAQVQADGVAYLNVSTCPHDVTDHGGGNYTAYERCRRCKASRDGYGYTPWSAPPEWRMLADEQCETCGGDPSADDHKCVKSMVQPGLDIREPGQHCDCSWENDVCHWCGIEWLGDGAYRCPDCHEGRPVHVHTINVPCWFPHEELGCVGLPSCDRHGLRPVEVTVRLVPYVGEAWVAPMPSIVSDDAGRFGLFDVDGETQIRTPSGPPLSPGDYVVVFTKVEAER